MKLKSLFAVFWGIFLTSFYWSEPGILQAQVDASESAAVPDFDSDSPERKQERHPPFEKLAPEEK